MVQALARRSGHYYLRQHLPHYIFNNVKGPRQMDLEKYWYEASPFIYTAVGGFMFRRLDSVLLDISSLLLLAAAGIIMLLRRKYSLKQLRRLRFRTALN